MFEVVRRRDATIHGGRRQVQHDASQRALLLARHHPLLFTTKVPPGRYRLLHRNRRPDWRAVPRSPPPHAHARRAACGGVRQIQPDLYPQHQPAGPTRRGVNRQSTEVAAHSMPRAYVRSRARGGAAPDLTAVSHSHRRFRSWSPVNGRPPPRPARRGASRSPFLAAARAAGRPRRRTFTGRRSCRERSGNLRAKTPANLYPRRPVITPRGHRAAERRCRPYGGADSKQLGVPQRRTPPPQRHRR